MPMGQVPRQQQPHAWPQQQQQQQQQRHASSARSSTSHQPHRTVQVSKIPPVADEAALERAFESCGSVLFAKIDRRQGVPCGTGVVVFESHTSAARAVEDMDYANVCGGRIGVGPYKADYAEPAPPPGSAAAARVAAAAAAAARAPASEPPAAQPSKDPRMAQSHHAAPRAMEQFRNSSQPAPRSTGQASSLPPLQPRAQPRSQPPAPPPAQQPLRPPPRMPSNDDDDDDDDESDEDDAPLSLRVAAAKPAPSSRPAQAKPPGKAGHSEPQRVGKASAGSSAAAAGGRGAASGAGSDNRVGAMLREGAALPREHQEDLLAAIDKVMRRAKESVAADRVRRSVHGWVVEAKKRGGGGGGASAGAVDWYVYRECDASSGGNKPSCTDLTMRSKKRVNEVFGGVAVAAAGPSRGGAAATGSAKPAAAPSQRAAPGRPYAEPDTSASDSDAESSGSDQPAPQPRASANPAPRRRIQLESEDSDDED